MTTRCLAAKALGVRRIDLWLMLQGLVKESITYIRTCLRPSTSSHFHVKKIAGLRTASYQLTSKEKECRWN